MNSPFCYQICSVFFAVRLIVVQNQQLTVEYKDFLDYKFNYFNCYFIKVFNLGAKVMMRSTCRLIFVWFCWTVLKRRREEPDFAVLPRVRSFGMHQQNPWSNIVNTEYLWRVQVKSGYTGSRVFAEGQSTHDAMVREGPIHFSLQTLQAEKEQKAGRQM